jgi:4-alpha-glucanotransferase
MSEQPCTAWPPASAWPRLDRRQQPPAGQRRGAAPCAASLGHPADDDQAIASSLRLVEQAEDSEHLPPLLTVDVGQPLALQRWFSAGSQAHCTLEDASQRTLVLDAEARLPGGLPTGYHQVAIDGRTFTWPWRRRAATRWKMPSANRHRAAGAWQCSCTACAAPAMAAMATAWRWNSWRSAAERGADALAISPMHALSAIDHQHYSPYSPSSRLLLNALYASPAALLGERGAHGHRSLRA